MPGHEILDGSSARNLHEWLYEIACALTYDREYLYRSFLRLFDSVMEGIFHGSVLDSGECIVHGLKSDLDARILWMLPRRLDSMGLNLVRMTCEILQKGTGTVLERHELWFELSNGEKVLF